MTTFEFEGKKFGYILDENMTQEDFEFMVFCMKTSFIHLKLVDNIRYKSKPRLLNETPSV